MQQLLVLIFVLEAFIYHQIDFVPLFELVVFKPFNL